ncbi:MAG: hypothetical protein KBC21_01950 [Candidatus Pacebacteria bacterium]|nr:hypothetical protein [Candidatus Paceibacterota bacterium]
MKQRRIPAKKGRSMHRVYSIVFIANTGRQDGPLPKYLLEALQRFQDEKKEGAPRYCLIAHDMSVYPGVSVRSPSLGLNGDGLSIQGAMLNMLGNFDPGQY